MSTPLEHLRRQMTAHKLQAVLIPSGDPHGSEYPGAHFQARAYLSGFHGSAGTLLVLPDWAGLWTDGRYFLQAERELSGSGIVLLRQGLPQTPTVEAILQERLREGDTLAFDGRCVSLREGKRLQQQLRAKGIVFCTEWDPVGAIWTDRPPLSAQPAWLLDDYYAGESRRDKLARTRQAMHTLGADSFLLTSLEEIAWLLNLRGGDIACTPVLLSYLALTQHSCLFFVNENSLSPTIHETLALDGIQVRPYADFYPYACAQEEGTRVLLDGRRANWQLGTCCKAQNILDRPSPIEGFKAIKNPIEIEHTRRAHVQDGLALTRFLYWLKQQTDLSLFTELDLSAQLSRFRQEGEHYLGDSFSPIVAYGAHGAIVHYSATEETNATLKPEGFLLLDSGGHYLEGTTDCTRTIALGALSEAARHHYTAVLRGHLALSRTQFPSGCTGSQLDALARMPLWALGLDYRHGTGHGVGHLLGVHEGPQQIRARLAPGEVPLAAGMITSNEPGVYLDGQYGIRLENLLLCTPCVENEYGAFLGFEALTLVPFEREALVSSQLNAEEVAQLNTYHQRVYETLAPLLSTEEAAWLRNVTRPL